MMFVFQWDRPYTIGNFEESCAAFGVASNGGDDNNVSLFT